MLARGEIDAVADYDDLLPRARRHSGIDVRSLNLGLDVYSSGLVAADRLAPEWSQRVVGAVIATLEQQRRDPGRGVAEVVARTPRVVPDDAREGWRLVEPRIFTGDPPGSRTSPTRIVSQCQLSACTDATFSQSPPDEATAGDTKNLTSWGDALRGDRRRSHLV